MAALSDSGLSPAQVRVFRRKLMGWYRTNARTLPWRGTCDPYRTWVSEVMLQQTRVAAVIEHYERFLKRFPTIFALALSPESDVLAAWSGLGYYRRARMLHKAAQFVVQALRGKIPETAEELRKLPGIGEYTCAAIASIAFGESIAVVDGNVERVLLRVTGRPENPTAVGRKFIGDQAEALMPFRRVGEGTNAAGDHNQAMMELGATICLPKAPLCLHCPVYGVCRTRGPHRTAPRDQQRSQQIAYLLATRKQGAVTEILLRRRDDDMSLMPGMLELPPLGSEDVEGRQPLMRLRHAITNTNYMVEIFGESASGEAVSGSLQAQVPATAESLEWYAAGRAGDLPLTGLARKVLHRLDLQAVIGPESPEAELERRQLEREQQQLEREQQQLEREQQQLRLA